MAGGRETPAADTRAPGGAPGGTRLVDLRKVNYVILGGENARVADAFAVLARLTGRRPPGVLPYWPIEAAALVRPQLRELITTSKGVTFWTTDRRARDELGYTARDLATGLRDTYGPMTVTPSR